ncbi:helix-turn-helix transcriptional regulator [Chloroflexota bacterium]
MEELKVKVKELRRKKGWTQEDLAREISVSLSTVQRWEKMGGKPTRLARRELSKLFREVGVEAINYNAERKVT